MQFIVSKTVVLYIFAVIDIVVIVFVIKDNVHIIFEKGARMMMISRIAISIASMTTTRRAKRSGTSVRRSASNTAGHIAMAIVVAINIAVDIAIAVSGRIWVTSCISEMGAILILIPQLEMRRRTAQTNAPV